VASRQCGPVYRQVDSIPAPGTESPSKGGFFVFINVLALGQLNRYLEFQLKDQYLATALEKPINL